MADEKLIKIRVNGEAKKVIKDTADKLDMKEQGVASRIYKWFALQDDVTKKHVLSLLPEGYEADLLRKAADRYEARKSGRK